MPWRGTSTFDQMIGFRRFVRARFKRGLPPAYPPPSRPLQIVPELMWDELGAPSGARVGGSAAAGRLPNSEVGDVWAGGLSRQRWARRRAPPHPGPTPRLGNRPWARGFE